MPDLALRRGRRTFSDRRNPPPYLANSGAERQVGVPPEPHTPGGAE